MSEAYRIVADFLKCFDEKALDTFVSDVEANGYVD